MTAARGVPKTVWVLGFISLLTDLSSEMIYPLLPVFLSSVLGATALQLGAIEGLAESTSALLKLVAGVWTDRVRKRKPFVVFGYGLAGLVRPLIGLAQSWQTVLLLRFTDRVGKGVRTSPRDALIADITNAESRGAAYGLHRSMDHAGAVIGPLAAAALLAIPGFQLRWVFLSAAVPAALSLFVALFALKESPKPQDKRQIETEAFRPIQDWQLFEADFRWLLLALFVFTLGNSTDAFLLMRLSKAGIPAGWIAALWSLHHIVKMVSTYHGGRLSDRVGPRAMILFGWLTYAVIYLAFALVESRGGLILIFISYGLYFGLVEPAEKAWIASAAPAHLRGTAFGYYHLVVGIAALPASLLFGLIWHQLGAPSAFVFGSILASLAAALLFKIKAYSEN